MSTKNFIIASDAGAGNNRGLVAAANDSRFAASTYSEPMTNFLIGVLGTDLAALRSELELLAPPVRVARRFEFKKNKSDIAFLADQDDARAIGAAFSKIEDQRENVDAHTTNRGLTMTLDRDEMLDGDIEQNVQMLTAILLRNDIVRAIAALNAAANNTNKVWSGTKNPDSDLAVDINTALTERGLAPNTVVSGSAAWLYRRAAYEASEKAGALMLANRTPAEVAAALGVDTFHISKTIFKASKGGAKASVLGDKVFMYYLDQMVSKEDGSNLKRFWSPCEGGEEFRVFVDESAAKTIDITVEQHSQILAVDTGGIRMFTVSQA